MFYVQVHVLAGNVLLDYMFVLYAENIFFRLAKLGHASLRVFSSFWLIMM